VSSPPDVRSAAPESATATAPGRDAIRPPHHTTVVAYLALLIAVGTGSAYAFNTVGSFDVINESLLSQDIQDNTLRSSDVRNDTLTGFDVRESTLRVSRMGCQSGLINGFARIKGRAGIPTFFTSSSDAIDRRSNCAQRSDGRALPVEVRRVERGIFIVRFQGNPSRLAMVGTNLDGEDTTAPVLGQQIRVVGFTAGVRRIDAGADAGGFEVRLSSTNHTSSLLTPDFVDNAFTIVVVGVFQPR
jgi:hypothetical protein